MSTGTDAQQPNPPGAGRVFEILVREHADMLDAYLRAITRSESSIDDLFQETMLVAWRRLGDYEPALPFAAWLRGIARVLVMEQARKSKARPRTTDPEVLTRVESHFASLAHHEGDTFIQRAQRLHACVERLPQAMRDAIQALYARGMSVRAAAGAIGVSEESIKKRVQRGRDLLADCLNLKEPTP